jgi:enamine deaminase RidA (YjgF/YER057c/UK114 family)
VEYGLLITIFIGTVAAAIFVQCLAFLGMHRSLREVSRQVDRVSQDLVKSLGSISSQTEQVLISIKEVAEKTQTLQENVMATSSIVHKRVVDLDAFLRDATDVARLQIIRMQEVVDTVSGRIESAAVALHRGVLAPVTEVGAISRGIKVGLNVFLRRRLRPATPSRQDEEMFI